MTLRNPAYPSSVYMITPISRKARQWVARNVDLEPWQWQGTGFALDARYAGVIVQAMLDQGMEDGRDFEVASGNPLRMDELRSLARELDEKYALDRERPYTTYDIYDLLVREYGLRFADSLSMSELAFIRRWFNRQRGWAGWKQNPPRSAHETNKEARAGSREATGMNVAEYFVANPDVRYLLVPPAGNPIAIGHMGPFIVPNPIETGAAALNPSRSAIEKKTWRARKREGGKGECAFCRRPVYAGGVEHGGHLYHKTCWDFKEAGLTPAQVGLNPMPPRPAGLEAGAAMAFNPRPPARWWAMMWPRVAAGYPRRRGEPLKHYRAAINQIVGGIWWGYPAHVRSRLLKRYENPIPPEPAGLMNPFFV